ncbi:MAG: penicillin-binding protein 2 [Zoogloeaceae bacterium]|jgi:cell division protein FtsI (penicillin-binding protein 3)|nr:penicillin-binding protein 2 [Zoogloeaceae bacterium]
MSTVRRRAKAHPLVENPLLKLALPAWRARFISYGLLLLFALVLGMAFYQQEVRGHFNQGKSNKVIMQNRRIPASRGSFVDRNGALLAASVPGKAILVDTLRLREAEEKAGNAKKSGSAKMEEIQKRKQKVADLLGLDAETLALRLQRKGLEAELLEQKIQEQKRLVAAALGLDMTTLAQRLQREGPELEMLKRKLQAQHLPLASGANVVLKRLVSQKLADQVAALNLPGLYLDVDYVRHYPQGEVIAPLVGIVRMGHDGLNEGQEGLEKSFDKRLAGEDGLMRVMVDRRGGAVDDIEMEGSRPPRNGENIRLSIDAKLQYLAFAAIKDAVQAHQAVWGGAVVVDALTGEILALAKWPSYDPDDSASRSNPSNRRNRVITDSFEPGSTLKPFTVALALEQGKFDVGSVLDCRGPLFIGGWRIGDSHPNGMLSVAQVIQRSSNICTARIATHLAYKDMWEMYDALGFGKPLGLDFPEERSGRGRVRPWKNWRPVEQATMSYGHGISVSLVQLAQAYLVFARDGDMIPITLMMRDEPPAGQRVFSPQTAREIRAMLEMVVNPGGTATQAQVPGYRVGGKTGTAYKLEGGQYTNKYLASFAGIAPISNPRFVIAVAVDEPSAGSHYGGAVAGPIFSRIAAGVLNARNIAPDAAQQVVQTAQPARGTL